MKHFVYYLNYLIAQMRILSVLSIFGVFTTLLFAADSNELGVTVTFALTVLAATIEAYLRNEDAPKP